MLFSPLNDNLDVFKHPDGEKTGLTVAYLCIRVGNRVVVPDHHPHPPRQEGLQEEKKNQNQKEKSKRNYDISQNVNYVMRSLYITIKLYMTYNILFDRYLVQID